MSLCPIKSAGEPSGVSPANVFAVGISFFVVSMVVLAIVDLAVPTAPGYQPKLELTGARRSIQTFLLTTVVWVGALSLMDAPTGPFSIVLGTCAIGLAAFGLTRATHGAMRLTGWSLVALGFLCAVDLNARIERLPWAAPSWNERLSFGAIAVLLASGPVLLTAINILYAAERHHLARVRLPSAVARAAPCSRASR